MQNMLGVDVCSLHFRTTIFKGFLFIPYSNITVRQELNENDSKYPKYAS
jgi:hypothetical protein